MLQLSSDQRESLAESTREAFVASMVRRIRSRFGERLEREGHGGGDVERIVRIGVRKARGYGVTKLRDVSVYLDCMLLLGPGFDRDPLHPVTA